MSRIGLQPITVPQGVDVGVADGRFTAEGPKGKVTERILEGIEVKIADQEVQVKRTSETRDLRAKHGLVRSLLANAVQGVSEGFTKNLEIVGVGYRAEVRGRELHMALGFSHPVVYAIPEGIDVVVEKNTSLSVTGANRQRVGQVAAELRGLRPPDPYKGKGVRYAGERLRLKVGKAGAK